jgi:choline-sulfatase
MKKRPNILLIASDEHSHRFLSARPYDKGGEPCHTPTLDGLINQGTHFDSAYCQMPLCSPSRISMLCGRHAHRCGAWGNGSILDPDLPTIGSHLQKAGYDTAVVGKLHLGGSLQHAGFGARPYGDFGGPCAHQFDPLSKGGPDEYKPGMDMRSRTLDAGLSEIPESMLQENTVARETIAWLRQQRHQNPDKPWMVFASFSRPHFPLTAPSRFLDRYWPQGVTPPRIGHNSDAMDHPMTQGAIKGFRTEEIDEAEALKARAGYFACVDLLDEILGDMLAMMQRDGLLDDTVIVYTSDHGEMAGEHGLWWKNTWHESSARVPLIFSLPQQRQIQTQNQPANQAAKREITTPASLADIFPTLCGLAGVDAPDTLDGVDLSPALRGEACPALADRSGVITENPTPRWGEGTDFRMLRSERYKYVAFRTCPDLAFDLQEDPDEQHNLLAQPDLPAELAATLAAMRQEILHGFDFDEVEAKRKRQSADLKQRFPQRVEPRTPNQILLGDGRLVEADQALYYPEVLSTDPDLDFDDFSA